MATNFGEQSMEQRLELVTLARDLNAAGRLSAADAARVMKTPVVRVHPLVFLAEQKLGDAAVPGMLWLAWAYPEWFFVVLLVALVLMVALIVLLAKFVRQLWQRRRRLPAPPEMERAIGQNRSL